MFASLDRNSIYSKNCIYYYHIPYLKATAKSCSGKVFPDHTVVLAGQIVIELIPTKLREESRRSCTEQYNPVGFAVGIKCRKYPLNKMARGFSRPQLRD